MQFARRRLAQAIAQLPEAQKIYATLSFNEGLGDTDIAESLGDSLDEIAKLGQETRTTLLPATPISSKEASGLRKAAENALQTRLKATTGATLDRAGRTARLEDAFLKSIPPDERAVVEADIRQGDGGELRVEIDQTLAPRFHSARSSCALAANAFGPWRLSPERLSIHGIEGFKSLRFERKCPIEGVPRNRTPPNLDAIAEGDRIVAVESKLLEYLTSKRAASFDEVYGDPVAKLADPSWVEAYRRLRGAPDEFQCFGASQIVKHYLGLKSAFPGRKVTLLYLYWEPSDRDSHRLFASHRAEIDSFAQHLADRDVTFDWLTYADLCDEWSGRDGPEWLPAHVEELRQRYFVSID